MISQTIRFGLCNVILCAASLLTATAAAAEIRHPPLEDQTFAVVRIDATQVNLDAMVHRIAQHLAESETSAALEQAKTNLAPFHTLAKTQVDSFLAAGGRDLFAVFGLEAFPHFYAAVPAGEGSEDLAKGIRATLNIFQNDAVTADRRPGFVLIGAKQTMERVKTRQSVPSSALAAAMQSCGDAVIQILILPTADQRRVLAEMLPALPAEYGMQGADVLLHGLEWAALGLEGPPKLSLNLTLQASGTGEAEALLALLHAAYALLGKQPEIRAAVPNLDALLEALRPRREGSRLHLQLDQATIDVLVNEAVKPYLPRSR